MEAVFFVFFLLAFVLVAPPHLVALAATGLLASSLIVGPLARLLSGAKVSTAAAFRTLVLGFLLSMLLAFALLNLLQDSPPAFKSALSHEGTHALAYVVYLVGFRRGLRLSWPHSAIVAAIPTLIVGASIWLAMSLNLPALHWPRP